MTIAKRLGNTVFGANDPFDDLRPARQKKVLSLTQEAPRAAPAESVAATPAIPDSVPVPPPSAPEEPVTPEPEALSPAPIEEERARPKARPKEVSEKEVQENHLRRVRFSANIAVSTKEKAEAAAYWIPGMTISALTEVALARELRRMEKEYNDGKPFEKAGKLKYGRPRSSE